MKNIKLKKYLIFTILCAVAISSLALTVSCGSKEKPATGYVKEYTVEFGETFVLPSELTVESVTDKRGNDIYVDNGRFVADDTGGYTIKIKNGDGDITVVVKDTAKPYFLNLKSVYACKTGETVDFSNIEAFDVACGKIIPTVTLKDPAGNAVPLINGGVTPYYSGKYTVTVTAEDLNGNLAEKTVPVYVSDEGDERSDIVAKFSAAAGLEQITGVYGFEKSFTTEEKFADNDEGSLKLQANFDINFNEGANTFYLTDLITRNVSDTAGVVFRIKNGSGYPLTLKLSSWVQLTLTPNEWSEVFVSKSHFDSYKEQSGNDGMQDLESIRFEVCPVVVKHIGLTPIYVSDVTYVRNLSTDEYRERANSLVKRDVTAGDGKIEYEYLNKVYSGYGESQKYELNDVQTALTSAYLKQYAVKYGVAVKDGKITYSDSELATKQLVPVDNSAVVSYDEFSDPKSGETGTTRILTGEGYGATLKLNYPLVSSDYSCDDAVTDLVNGNEYIYSVYRKITFRVFWKGATKKIAKLQFNGQEVEVKNGEWTDVEFKLYDKTLSDTQFYFYSAGDGAGLFSNQTVYMTSIYAEVATTVEQMDYLINELVNADIPYSEFETSKKFLEVYERYTELPAGKKVKLKNREKLFEELRVKLLPAYGTEYSADKKLYFDSPVGLSQIFVTNATAEYTTENAYGGENGSLKITTNRAWQIKLDMLFPLGKLKYGEEYVVRIFIDGVKDKTQNFVISSTPYSEDFVVKSGEWVEYTLVSQYSDGSGSNKKIALFENSIEIFTEGWKTAVPANVTIYFSAVTVKK